MAGSGKTNSVRDFVERARRLFAAPERRDLLLENAPRKKGLIISFCVFASCLLWFTFSMRETYTQYFDFPTQIENLPDDRALVELPPSTVRVQVEGEGISLLRLYYNPPTVPIDATVDEIDLQVVTAEVAGNVRHESVLPTTIAVKTEMRITRRLPIRSALEIDTESGYELVGPIIITPDSVTVSGALSVVTGMDFWPTSRQHLQAVRDTIRINLPLSDTLEGLIIIGLPEVALQADVVRLTSGTREISIRVKDGPVQDSFTFEPPTTTVTYNIPLFQFDMALAADDFYAFVPYDELMADTTGNVYPMVNLPEGILLREIHIIPNAFRYYRNLPGPN